MPLYFAYGANMDVESMAKRCPASKPVGLARLPRHRWIISSDGYANVVPDPRRDVHGMLWELALSDVPPLDRFEDVPRLYRKITQPVISTKGIRRALVYVGRAVETGRPRPGYLEDVIRAAQAAELPAATITEMRKFGDVRPAIAAPATAAKSQKWVWTP
ncbi:MAG: gamma-glutamylcyclotransferase family protein [Beijerinckiaceae bacterium]